MNNIFVQDVGAEKDAITSLRAPTHFGRPNWDRVFGGIAERTGEGDVGVVSALFFVGFGLIADGGFFNVISSFVDRVCFRNSCIR